MTQINQSSRLTNIELLRLITMGLVLLLHANFITFGPPSAGELLTKPFNAIGRVFLEHLCIIAVNVYVLISGWFGIKPKTSSLVKFILQITTYSVIGLILAFIFNRASVSKWSITEVLIIGKYYWYVVAYLLLYILSPILNIFVEKSDPKTIRITLLFYFLFEFIYGWLNGLCDFNDGFSTISFIGLYILARYLRLYGGRITKYSKKTYFAIYIISTAILTSIVVIQLYIWGYVYHDDYMISYHNPLVVLSALVFFLMFEKMSFSNKYINYWASSAFSIYIIHSNPHIWRPFLEFIENIYIYSPNFIGCILILVFLVLYMIGCLVIDKVRIAITPISYIVRKTTIFWIRIKSLI